MNVRMGLLRKKADWTTAQFLAYWRNEHGPLASRVPNLREYWQNAVTERVEAGDIAPGAWQFDGFSQLWFDDAGQANHAFKHSELAAALIADEQHFLGGLHIVTAEQHAVVPVPPAPQRTALLKRVSVLKRRANSTEEDFRREWATHGHLVATMPGVSGYRQNVVSARERVKGRPCGYEELPIDGIGELWFDNPGHQDAALRSTAGRTAMAHAKTFLAEVGAFLVVERRIV